MLSFECIKNEKSVYFLLTSADWLPADLVLGSRYLFSALAAQLLEYLASRELTFGQPIPLLRACCTTPHLIEVVS